MPTSVHRTDTSKLTLWAPSHELVLTALNTIPQEARWVKGTVTLSAARQDNPYGDHESGGRYTTKRQESRPRPAPIRAIMEYVPGGRSDGGRSMGTFKPREVRMLQREQSDEARLLDLVCGCGVEEIEYRLPAHNANAQEEGLYDFLNGALPEAFRGGYRFVEAAIVFNQEDQRPESYFALHRPSARREPTRGAQGRELELVVSTLIGRNREKLTKWFESLGTASPADGYRGRIMSRGVLDEALAS